MRRAGYSGRSEGFLADSHGRDHHSRASLAVVGDGCFLALKVETVANIDAVVSAYAAFVPTWSSAGIQTGVYDIPALFVHVRGALTNTAPVDAYRGAGRPETAYLLERLVDRAGRETGWGPVEIHRCNFISTTAMPYRTAGRCTYDMGTFDLPGKTNGSRGARTPARHRVCLLYRDLCRWRGGNRNGARGRHGRRTVRIGIQSTGQGHETAFAQMTAAALGLPLAAITVIQGKRDQVASGAGTSASRTLAVGGAALHQALAGIMAAGGVAAGRPEGLSVTATYAPPAATFPNGCHIAARWRSILQPAPWP